MEFRIWGLGLGNGSDARGKPPRLAAETGARQVALHQHTSCSWARAESCSPSNIMGIILSGTGTPLPGGSSGGVPTPKGVGRKGGCKELAPTHNMHPAERDAGEGLRHRAAAGTLPLAGVRVGRRTKHGGSGRVQEDDYFVLLTFSQFLACSVVLLLAYATGRDLRACGVVRPAGAAPGYSG